jgi:hypothetical protein
MLEAETGSEGQIPMRGSSEGIYKHSVGENWASDISRLVTWDHIMSAPTTLSVIQVGHTAISVVV